MKCVATLLFTLALLVPATLGNHLFYYPKGGEPHCFMEEIPQDTMIVANFNVTQLNEQTSEYVPNGDISVVVTVKVVAVLDRVGLCLCCAM